MDDTFQITEEAIELARKWQNRANELQTHLSPFVVCRFYDDFDMRRDQDTFAVRGVVYCNQYAITISCRSGCAAGVT